MKDMFWLLFWDEKFKIFGKIFLKNVGFLDLEFWKYLNFSKLIIVRVNYKVVNVKFVFFDMWKMVFWMVCFCYFGWFGKNLLLKVKFVMKKLGVGDFLLRERI